jgi:hypothetical protein
MYHIVPKAGWWDLGRFVSQWDEAEANQSCDGTGRYRLLLRWPETIPFSSTDGVHFHHAG